MPLSAAPPHYLSAHTPANTTPVFSSTVLQGHHPAGAVSAAPGLTVTVAGPGSPAAPPCSPPLPASPCADGQLLEDDAPNHGASAIPTRPSRWESAGLPSLSRSATLSDLDALMCNVSPLISCAPSPPPTVSPSFTEWSTNDGSCTPPRDDHATTKELLMEILRRNSNPKVRNSRQDYVCVFCRNNGEDKSIFTSHRLKDVNGVIQCPVLRIYVCPTCGATGDQAHTLKYCPKAKDTANRVPLCSPRKSNGKLRLPNNY